MISALVTISIAASETVRCCGYGEGESRTLPRGPPAPGTSPGGEKGAGCTGVECAGAALSLGAAAFAPATPIPEVPPPRQYTVAASVESDGAAEVAGGGEGVGSEEGMASWNVFPAYIRTTSTLLCAIILGVGVAGNVMVPLVILRSRDMRNSTNVFLVNLSVADLLVLLVCAPTLLVEVYSRPEEWILGPHMCKAVPFVELTVAHASVLTILAISFERYYAICEPLKAGYVCTKGRAFILCLLSWAVAAIFTSPILLFPEYISATKYYDGSVIPTCFLDVRETLQVAFFLTTISLFFLLPFALLLVLYSVIARHLMLSGPRSTGEGETGCAASGSSDGAAVRALVRATLGTAVRGGATHNRSGSNSLRGGSGSGRGIGTGCGDGAAVRRSRRQVVMMLGTVVFSFFVCLFPFRIVILMTITNEFGALGTLGPDTYYPVMYGSRLLIYLHSALDPCLYSLMSSKFRRGLGRIFCGWRRVRKLRRCYRMRVPGEAASEMGATRNGAASSPHTGSLRTSSFSRTLRGSRGKSLKGEPPKLSTLEEGASGCEARSSDAKDAAPRMELPVPKTSLLVEQVVAGGEIFL